MIGGKGGEGFYTGFFKQRGNPSVAPHLPGNCLLAMVLQLEYTFGKKF